MATDQTPASKKSYPRLLFFAPEAKDEQILESYRLYLDSLIRLDRHKLAIMAPNQSPLAKFARDGGLDFHPLSDFSRTLLMRTPQLWPILSAMGRFRFDLAISHEGYACRGLNIISRNVVGICLDDNFKSFEAADLVIAQSSGGVSQAESVLGDEKSLACLPPPHFCSNLTPKSLPPGSNLTIGAGGKMAESQGLGRFVHAAQLIHQALPDVRFVIAGSGGEEHELKELSDQIAPFIDFPGSMTMNEMAEEFDIYCSTAIEAAFLPELCAMMDAGLACMATCTNGAMDILKAGMVAPMLPTDDSFMLAVQLQELLEDRAHIERIKQSCFERIREEDFHPQTFTTRLGEILDQMAHPN